MSRALFMAKLEDGLAGLPQPEIDEIVSDYAHHFSEAAAAGQSDNDIVARLGDPARLAQELRGGREQRLSAKEELPAAAPPAASSDTRMVSRLLLPLTLLAVIGAAVTATYFAGHDVRGSGPAMIANVAPPAPPPPAAPPQAGARIVISGGQTLDLGVITQNKIEIVLDGGGRATARGKVAELTLHVDGSGSADFGALRADIVHVDVSGTGSAEVSGTQLVDVTLSGSGTVRLRDRPRILKQSVTGSGKVILPTAPP